MNKLNFPSFKNLESFFMRVGKCFCWESVRNIDFWKNIWWNENKVVNFPNKISLKFLFVCA
jgi:hypothetical protein